MALGFPFITSRITSHLFLQYIVLILVQIIPSLGAAGIPLDRIDLGRIPDDGEEAVKTMPYRMDAVIIANACGRELEWWNEVDRPNLEGDERFKGGDPYPELIAKAAYLVQHARDNRCRASVPYGTKVTDDPRRDPGLPWEEPFTHFAWEDQLSAEKKERILGDINHFFSVRFGEACNSAVVDLVTPPPPGQQAHLVFELTMGCLKAQINKVLMTRDRFGSNPGSSGLPCHAVGKPTPGDWDMAVYQLTRLVYIARGVPDLFLNDTRAKLDQLLTISGPLQGDSYGLYQCGNPDNTTGSAEERAAEADFYDDGFFDDLGGLLEWLLAFLIVLLILIAPALLAVATGLTLTPAGQIAVALAGMPAIVGALVFNLLRIEETENHLLMINSSKYLKNQLIISELMDETDKNTFKSYNNNIRDWLLDRFQRIVKEDFVEYNSRPYQRLSIGAILNIHDFAEDATLRTAAASVLDLAAAKMALASNQGRRIVPFRRLAGTNAVFTYGHDPAKDQPQHLFDLGSGADHMISAMLLWAGQTQHTENNRASTAAGTDMIFEATSSYRPHALILDIAIDKSRSYEQRIHHGGWEHYSSGPGWLLSSGGTSTTFAQTALIAPFSIPFIPPLSTEFKLLKNENRGAGVPTTLMPRTTNVRQDRYRDFLRFEGIVKFWDKEDEKAAQPISYDGNLCMHNGFACGLRLMVPPHIEDCLNHPPGTPQNLSFIDSTLCPPYTEAPRLPYAEAPRFFVVVYRQPCPPDGFDDCNGPWGFIEVVNATPEQSFSEFIQATIQRNGDRFAQMLTAADDDGIESISYVSWNSGIILFDPDRPSDEDDATGILQLNGGPDPRADLDDWGRAEGDILTYRDDARVSIGRPLDPRKIEIDFRDAEDPKRVTPP